MTKQARQLTDPVREYATLIANFTKQEPQQTAAAHIILRNMLNNTTISDPLLLAYGIMNRRADDLVALISNFSDENFDEDLKEASLSALEATRQVFSLNEMTSSWKDVSRKYLRNEYTVTFKFLSPMIVKQYPLAILNYQEIYDVTVSLEHSLKSILVDDSVPQWAKLQLSSSIVEMNFCLGHVDMFGHSHIIDSMLLLLRKSSALSERLPEQSSTRKNVLELCATIVLAVDLFVAAPNMAQATLSYYGWAKDLVTSATQLLEPPPLQIAGPQQGDRA